MTNLGGGPVLPSISGLTYFDLTDDSTLTITSAPDVDSVAAVTGTVGATLTGGPVKPHDVSDGVEWTGTATEYFTSSATLADWRPFHETAGSIGFVFRPDAAGVTLIDNCSTNDANTGFFSSINGGGTLVVEVCNGTGTAHVQAIKTGITTGAWHVAEFHWDAGGYKLKYDSDAAVTGSVTGSPAAANPSSGLKLGAHQNGVTAPFNGVVAAAYWLVGTKMTTSQDEDMTAFLKSRFGL